MDEVIETTLKNRADAMATGIMLNTILYGDSHQLTRWERIKRFFSVRRDRIHDAWLVLTGKADIGY